MVHLGFSAKWISICFFSLKARIVSSTVCVSLTTLPHWFFPRLLCTSRFSAYCSTAFRNLLETSLALFLDHVATARMFSLSLYLRVQEERVHTAGTGNTSRVRAARAEAPLSLVMRVGPRSPTHSALSDMLSSLGRVCVHARPYLPKGPRVALCMQTTCNKHATYVTVNGPPRTETRVRPARQLSPSREGVPAPWEAPTWRQLVVSLRVSLKMPTICPRRALSDGNGAPTFSELCSKFPKSFPQVPCNF